MEGPGRVQHWHNVMPSSEALVEVKCQTFRICRAAEEGSLTQGVLEGVYCPNWYCPPAKRIRKLGGGCRVCVRWEEVTREYVPGNLPGDQPCCVCPAP